MTSWVSHDSEQPQALQPLTERVLRALPGERPVQVVIWALVPWANGALNLLLDTKSKSAVWEQSGILVVLNYATVSLAILLSIWGSRRIAIRLAELRGPQPFRELNSAAAPLLGTVATAMAFGITAFVQDGLIAAFVRGVTWLIVGAALWSFLWTSRLVLTGLSDEVGFAIGFGVLVVALATFFSSLVTSPSSNGRSQGGGVEARA